MLVLSCFAVYKCYGKIGAKTDWKDEEKQHFWWKNSIWSRSRSLIDRDQAKVRKFEINKGSRSSLFLIAIKTRDCADAETSNLNLTHLGCEFGNGAFHKSCRELKELSNGIKYVQIGVLQNMLCWSHWKYSKFDCTA